MENNRETPNTNDDQTNDTNNVQGIRRGRYVEITSLIYNITEVAISLTAGFATGSSALVSWGVDSIVECNSAAFMIWRLHGEEKGISDREVRKRKKIALSVLSAAFTIAVLFICYEAISKLIGQESASLSWWGIGILLVSLVVNPMLAWGKHYYGKKTDSPSLKYDAIDTMICEYQTIVVLIGIGLVQWQGWWWADPIAALLIVPYVAWEAYEAGRDAWAVDLDQQTKGGDES
jgi:cation diffusion facilitator family transporter